MPERLPLHIAVVSEYDLHDVRSFSGTPYHMVKALRGQVERVSTVGPLPKRGQVTERFKKLRYRLRGQGYLRAHTETVMRGYAEAAAPELRRLRPDLVLTFNSVTVPYLEAACPIVMWSDATFEANLHYYGDYTNLSEENIREGHRLERLAMERAALSLFATEHSVRSAVGFYDIPAENVRLALYGGNLEPEPERTWVEAGVEARPRDECQLLFLGSGWERKGGDIALRVAEEMSRRGLPTKLVIAGGPPPDRSSPFVHWAGFLRKDDPAQRQALYDLMVRSHFLCMPVRAEAFGCAFAEAPAFGVPSLTTATGGMPTTVGTGADGFPASGLLFPPQAGPLPIAERALELMRQPEAYRALCAAARERYERRLNWDVATAHAVRLMASLVR